MTIETVIAGVSLLVTLAALVFARRVADRARKQIEEAETRIKEATKEASAIIARSLRASISDEFFMTAILASNIKAGDRQGRNESKEPEPFEPDLIVAVCPGGAMVAEWLSRRFLGQAKMAIPVAIVQIDRMTDAQGARQTRAYWTLPTGPGTGPGTGTDPEWPRPRILLRGAQEPLRRIPVQRILIVNDVIRGAATLSAAKDLVRETFEVDPDNLRIAVLFKFADADGVRTDYYVDETTNAVRFEWKGH